MKKNFILASCLLAGSLQAQFQLSYGTTNNEATPAVFPTSDGGFISAGKTDLPVFGGIDATLIKTNVNGAQLWSKVYGGQGIDQFNSVKQTPNANMPYVAVGSTSSYSGSLDAYFVGTDINGVPLVSKIFGGTNIDRFNHIQKIVHPVDGPGYIMVGESNSFGFYGAGYDIYVVRVDLFGNLKASVVIGNTGDQLGNWIEPTTDGYIIAGSTTINCTPSTTGAIQSDIYAVKLDFNLNLVWDRVIGNNNVLRNDVAYCVKVDNVGNYVFTGETQSYGLPGGDAFLLKLTPAGNPVFLRTYGGARNDQGRSLVVHKTATGVFYVVTGFASSYNTLATPDAYLFKTDANGVHIWSRVYGKEKPDYSFEVNLSSAAGTGYVLSGNELSFGAGGSDAYLLKTDVNGLSASACDIPVTPTVQGYLPCIYKGAQYVKVDVQKQVVTPYKALLYNIYKCVVISPAKEALEEESTTNSAITLSPNPASTQLQLTVATELLGASVSIVSLNGKTVKSFNVASEAQTISVEELEEGLYMILISQTNGTLLKEKLVIKH